MKIQAPVRIQHTYLQQYPEFPPEAVFPMLCPVMEAKWVPGWDAEMVLTQSGFVEPGCTFITRQEGQASIWYTVRHDPVNLELEFVKITPGVTACHIQIQVTPDGDGGSQARVSYAHTALGPEGHVLVNALTWDAYQEAMQQWEKALNAYLASLR